MILVDFKGTYQDLLRSVCLAMPMLLLPRRVRRKRVVTSKIVQLASKMGIESDCGDAVLDETMLCWRTKLGERGEGVERWRLRLERRDPGQWPLRDPRKSQAQDGPGLALALTHTGRRAGGNRLLGHRSIHGGKVHVCVSGWAGRWYVPL